MGFLNVGTVTYCHYGSESGSDGSRIGTREILQ